MPDSLAPPEGFDVVASCGVVAILALPAVIYDRGFGEIERGPPSIDSGVAASAGAGRKLLNFGAPLKSNSYLRCLLRPHHLASKSGFPDHQSGCHGVEFEFALRVRLVFLPLIRVVNACFD